MKNIPISLIIVIITAMFLLSSCGYKMPEEKEDTTFVPVGEIKILEEEAPSEVEEEAEIPVTEGEAIEIPEEVEEEVEIPLAEEKEEAIVIIVEETNLISLVPKASDPDADKLTYTFSSPLNDNGEWQTKYGDAGEYTVTVTASDGELSSSQDVLLIVNKKEEAPVIDLAMPKEKTLEVDENSKIEFSATASDLNGDKLMYSWKLDGAEISTDNLYTYTITYDDAGSHTIKIDVSDGILTTTNIWSITVKNVNRAPVLDPIKDITAKETETILIVPTANDPDKDELTFKISEPVGDDGEWVTTYDNAGTYKVTVTVSDGTDEDSQEVNIEVKNVNRPPVITGIVNR